MAQNLKEFLVGIDFANLGLVELNCALAEGHAQQDEIVTGVGGLRNARTDSWQCTRRSFWREPAVPWEPWRLTRS